MLVNQVDITSLCKILRAYDSARPSIQDVLVDIAQSNIGFVTQHADYMTHIRSIDSLAGFEEFIELFENAPSERNSIGATLYSDFVATRVDLDFQRPFDQPKRLFAVPVDCNGRRVVVEGQARGCRFMFSSQ